MPTTHRSELVDTVTNALMDEAYDGGMGPMSETEFPRHVRRLAETALEAITGEVGERLDLDDLEAKATAASGGPWHWAGNTDTGEPYLATWTPGFGRCQVLAIGYDERSATGREAESMRSSLDECGYDAEDIDRLVTEWAVDSFGSPRREPRLEFATDLMMVNARDLAIYEVAPEATSRDHPDVYRADVVGIRHPDAEYIAAAHPAVVLALIAELRALRAAVGTREKASDE